MAETAADVVVGLAWLAVGALLWRRRCLAGVVAATGAAWLAGSVVESLALLHRGPLAHVLLTYPAGALAGLVEPVVVAAAYLDGVVHPVGRDAVATLVLAGVLVAAMVRRVVLETGAVRRSRLAPLAVGVPVAGVLSAGAAIRLGGLAAGDWLGWLYDAVMLVVPFALLADLRAGDWARDTITGLVVDLGKGGPQTLSRTLARAVGDPSLTIAYALDDGGAFIDERGRTVTPPAADSARAVTPLFDAGRLVAVLVHDPAALGDPELLADARAAVGVAVANARLQADVRRRVEEVAASRRRLLHASDAQRRRLAAELDAAVVPRLDAAARLLPDQDVDLGRRLSEARSGLRRLVLGLRPPGLQDFGLAHALRELVADSPVEVSLEVVPGRWDDDVEATVWFVCAEALANVVKHSGATAVWIGVTAVARRLVVEVADDGIGGADPARGSGLRGLAARVGALGGTLVVDGGREGGTRLVAELPAGGSASGD